MILIHYVLGKKHETIINSLLLLIKNKMYYN